MTRYDVAWNARKLWPGRAWPTPGKYGIYVIWASDSYWTYRPDRVRWANTIAYIGQGKIFSRLNAHADGRGDPLIARLLQDGETLWVSYAALGSKKAAECAEAVLIGEFQRRFGEYPPGNQAGPSCSVDRRIRFRNLYPAITRRTFRAPRYVGRNRW